MRSHTRSLFTRCASAAVAGVFGATVLTAGAGTARADEVSPKGKGITGGALLGAEVVTIVESLAGVRSGWAYGVGALGGGIAGGIGGYFVEQGSTDGRIPVYMLAGGLALVIPAVVLTLNATRYMPDEGATEDKTPVDVTPADPGKVGGPGSSGAAPAPVTPSPAAPSGGGAPGPAPSPSPAPTPPPPQVPDALLHMNLDVTQKTAMRVGVPVPTVKQMWSASEQRQYGLQQGTEVRMPVVKVVF